MRIRYDILKYRFILLFVNLFRIFVKKKDKHSQMSFFILGSGRNGSTLLASILNGHKQLFIPPEQFVLPYAIMQRYLLFYETAVDWKKNILRMFGDSRKTLNWDLKIEDFNLDHKDVGLLFDRVYMKYASQIKNEVRMWGDKTPINIHFIDFIYPEFSHSKYIFLVRDARDVVLSYKRLKGHRANDTSYAIWKWKDSISKLKKIQNKCNVLVVKYEDLVTDPVNVTNKILNYLGFEDQDNLIKYKRSSKIMGVSQKSHHQNLDKPISKNSIGRWRNYLSDKEVNQINRSCYQYLKEFNYSVD